MSSRPKITTERRALETLHQRTRADVRASSAERGWRCLAASRFHQQELDVALPPLGVQSIGLNYGEGFHLGRTLRGETLKGRTVPGHIALFPPDADTRWVFDRVGDIVVVHLSQLLIDRTIEESLEKDARTVEILPRFLIRDVVIERIVHELIGELSMPRIGTNLYADTLAQALAIHLIRSHSNREDTADPRPYALSPQKLNQAKAFIEANLEKDISLHEIASAVGMSLFHFAKSFKSATGRPPYQYVTERRMERARSLLHDTDLPIAHVAHAVGLQSQSHFTTVFARHLGMTPRRFRQVLRS